MNAKRDENRRVVITGVKPDGSIGEAEIDNSTGRLLVNIEHVSDVAPTAMPTEVRDDNREATAYGVDSNGDPQSVLIDNRNGNVWGDVNIE